MAKITTENLGSRRMKTLPRMKLIAACVGAAMVQLAAGPARADSAIGVDTALGNALNPPGRSAMPRPLMDDDGMDTVRRSPTGQLYGVPYDRSDEGSNKTDGGWEYSGGIEAGVLGGDAGKKNALFRKYKDLKNGAYLDYFEAEGYKPDSANYVQTFGGGAGQNDQFYGLQFGRFNDWKVKVFYNETQHVFTDTYKSLYNGAGTGNLTLAGGLRPKGGAMPVTSGSPTVGTGACTAAAPCWSYTDSSGTNRVFSNATALAGINWTGSATTAAGTPIGANSIAGSINSYLNGVSGDTELAIVRKKAGVMADVRLADHWKVYSSYSNEERKGSRPFSVNENNYTAEIPEPIDYTTHDFLAGFSYTDPLMQANLRASASLFRNNISSLTVQQPWLAAATGFAAAQTTTFDLYPDNNAFNLKGEFARSLPDLWKGRFTANAAWGTSRQNDALMMPVDQSQSSQIASAMGTTIIPGNNPGYATNTLNLNNWNGVNGSPLSQSTAKQRIDTTLLNFGLLLNPLTDLSVKGDVRYFENDNKGGYTAYNPLTGQFGRGFIRSTSFDLVVGSAGAPGAVGAPCFVLPGFPVVPGCKFNGNAGVTGQSTNNPANVPVVSPARDTKQLNYALAADYDLGKKWGSFNSAIEREDFHRTYRERDKTWEDKVKLGYVNRGFEETTVRVSYEDTRRRGSDYEFWPAADFGTGLPGLDWNTIWTQYLKTAAAAPGWTVAPANIAGYLARYAYESRKFDQADRNQQIFNGRVNVMPRPDMDLGVAVQFKDANYPDSGYGLEKDKLTSVNFDVNYQPSTTTQVFGYYSLQDGTRSMRANTGTNATNAGNTCTFPVASTLTLDQAIVQCAQQVWTTAGAWNLDTKDKNDVLGLGFQTAIRTMKLGVDYVYSTSKSKVSYDYGAGALTAAQAVLAGSAFPDMTLIQNTVTAHLTIPIEKKIAVHLLYRFESGRIKDWHYANMPIGASAAENNASVMLDAGPQNYHTNVYGAFLQFKL
jgi:hypothetical protein